MYIVTAGYNDGVIAKIELWFDFSCPYAYLASRRAHTLGMEIDWRPMLLGGVFRGIGAGDGPMATLSAAKARHNVADMYRWAEVFDAPFQVPAAHPMRTVRALRTLLALPHATWPEAIPAIFAAYWQRAEDVTSAPVIAAALAGAGIDPETIATAQAAADGDPIKDALRARTDEAIALGIFGAPAWIVRRDGHSPILVWGQDRFAWLEAIRDGWDPEINPPPVGSRSLPPSPAHAGARAELYFDVSSPFAYLALTQLDALIAATGVTPTLQPILLGALFKELGTTNVPLFTFPPPKLRYVGLEMARWARWWGVPLAMPSKFPQRTVTAQRLCILAAAEGFAVGVEVATALGRAMWAEDRDLEDPATLVAIVDACGQPGAAWVARCADADIKQALVATTAAARAANVFGVPTVVVDGATLIWGQDRLDLVVRALAGWKPVHG